jgi:hypothetical protein
MVEYAYKENGVMKLKPVALSLSQSEIDEIATELLEAMQPDWQNAVQLTVAQLDAGYVCPSDGYLCLNFLIQGGTNAFVSITVNDIGIATAWNGINQSALSVGQAQCQVNKGDVVRTFYSTGVSITPYGYNPFHFVPFKTSNPVSLRPLDPHKIDTAILNHWDDITSDFSTAGSSNVAIDNAKYNPILRKLRIKCHNTTSQASGSGRAFVITYNGSDLPAFTDSCIYTGSKIQTSDVAGFEFSAWVKQANQVSFYIYNRTSSAWPANTYTNIQVEF